MTATAEPVRFALDWGRRYSLWVMQVGLACCAVEFVAATVGRPDLFRLGIPDPAQRSGAAHVMVVAGTVTDVMAPAVRAAYERLPEPAYVLSFGACSNSGGPYWDSYSVVKGVDTVIPVDVYVPGCPPRPEALLRGLLELPEPVRAADEAGQR